MNAIHGCWANVFAEQLPGSNNDFVFPYWLDDNSLNLAMDSINKCGLKRKDE